MTIIIGLDVGGAHLKVSRVEDGRPVETRQIVCPLWLGMDRLDAALAEAAPMTAGADQVAATMTGELSDLFADRCEGVERLVTRLTDAFGSATRFWMGSLGFGTAEDAIREFPNTASANFLATAKYVGTKCTEALVIDMGSTTTDIIPVFEGRPRVRGLDDSGRLASGELVYTGLTRTAVMAVATEAPFGGRWQGLAREYFATMADVRRILGELPDNVDQHETADRKGKSVEESIARLARMFGRDASDGRAEEWQAAARFLAARQERSIEDGLDQVLSGTPPPVSAPVVVAGIGAAVIEKVAARLGLESLRFGALVEASSTCRADATENAPAVAIALLAEAEPQAEFRDR